MLDEVVVLKHLLEGRLSTEIYSQLRAAVVASWDQDFANDPGNQSAVDAVVFRRHDQTVKFTLPWIDSVYPLSGSSWVDFGCGCGSSSMALSHFAKAVHGFEIDNVSIDAFRKRMELFRVDNAQVVHSSPDCIIEDACEQIQSDTSVLMLAVIEHLTDAERVRYLRDIWEKLSPGQVLVVAETPNFACWFDTHTHGVPFIHLASDGIFYRYLRNQPKDFRFRDSLLKVLDTEGMEAAKIARKRSGVGATYHLFEVAFGCDLNEIVVADGFDPLMDFWLPMLVDDRLLLSAFDAYSVNVPVGFARSVLSFVFQKPVNSKAAESARLWNESRRREIISTYGLLRNGDLSPSGGMAN